MTANVSHETPSRRISGNWLLIPEHCRDGLDAYLGEGRPVGHFLTAVLSNDLAAAAGRADDENRPRLADYVRFLYSYAPAGSWGSPKAVKDWIARGGLAGRAAA